MSIPIITLESRHGQISGACWLASLAKAVRFKSSERLSQGQGGDSRVRHLLSSGFYMQVCTHMLHILQTTRKI